MTPPPSPDHLRPVTLITGGSRGIGAALAHEFAKTGHDLLLVARDKEALQRIAHILREQTSAEIAMLVLDLCDENAGQRIENHLRDHGVYCQNLVNNAGYGLAGHFDKHGAEDLLCMTDVNMRVLTDLSHRFLPDMLARREGGILNVASMGGLFPGPYQAAYYASKAYVISLTRALSWEYVGCGVHFCALTPGPVRTDFHQTMGALSRYYIKVGGGISAQRAARMGYSGFKCGKTLVIPGLLTQLGAIFIKIIPHDLLMPVMAWFLKARLWDRK